jgi:hypothetical protein
MARTLTPVVDPAQPQPPIDLVHAPLLMASHQLILTSPGTKTLTPFEVIAQSDTAPWTIWWEFETAGDTSAYGRVEVTAFLRGVDADGNETFTKTEVTASTTPDEVTSGSFLIDTNPPTVRVDLIGHVRIESSAAENVEMGVSRVEFRIE